MAAHLIAGSMQDRSNEVSATNNGFFLLDCLIYLYEMSMAADFYSMCSVSQAWHIFFQKKSPKNALMYKKFPKWNAVIPRKFLKKQGSNLTAR